MEQVAADKVAAENMLSEKKEAAKAAWQAVSGAEKESRKAHWEMLQATKTAGFKESNEQHALDAAAALRERGRGGAQSTSGDDAPDEAVGYAGDAVGDGALCDSSAAADKARAS